MWETRVRDYSVFTKETQRAWPKDRDVTQEQHDPAVHLSWEDATAFCAWLTRREQQAGRLGHDEAYRLPTDYEWSCAVGIGEQEDATKRPGGKDRKIPALYPWGMGWPPPPNCGNYWSEELRTLLRAGKLRWIRGELHGYRDGFPTVSLVGSYAANRFGLHDLGGNAWAWCDDRIDGVDGKNDRRVLRGASWALSSPDTLLSSARHQAEPSDRNYNNGFRAVLAAITARVVRQPQAQVRKPPDVKASISKGTPPP